MAGTSSSDSGVSRHSLASDTTNDFTYQDLATLFQPIHHQEQDTSLRPGPVWLILGAFIDALLFESISFPILYRHNYYILLRIGFATGVAWLILRLVTWGMEKLKNSAITPGRPEAVSLVLLGQRLLKAFVLVLASLAIMRAFGFDTSTVLADVGIGGLAISFGAHKPIENLFGGATILGDSVIHVGDICRIGDRIGTIEDISLRSTCIRTLERTEL
jgi:MscS family membrane protein